MKIKKGGCVLEVTESKFVNHYKYSGYEIVEEEKHDLDKMTYQELQAFYSLKFDKSAVGVKKSDILKELNEVI